MTEVRLAKPGTKVWWEGSPYTVFRQARRTSFIRSDRDKRVLVQVPRTEKIDIACPECGNGPAFMHEKNCSISGWNFL